MTQKDAAETIWDMLGDHAICMFITQVEGHLRARPMVAMPDPEESLIWFIAGTEGAKSEEIAANSHVCVTYARPSDQDFLSISGTASVVDDKKKMKELWNPGAQAWFPEGPESGRATLIKVAPSAGEYWDAIGNKIILGVNLMEARIKGERPDIGENEKVVF